MGRAITAPELALLRGDGQWTKLYLAIYKPNVIYSALLNGVPASNDRVYEVAFDGGVGTLASVKANMTCYVGTTAGGHELGMCRIRKAPIAGTFYIGLTSEIAWVDNAYLTVTDEFDLWAKHATVASGVLSMDVDIGYSDQHSTFNPVPVLGSHVVAFLDAATVDVLFDGSGSWVIGSTISGHVWTAPGSSASSGLTTATPTITYNAPGCYCVYDTVTAANGKATEGVRYVFIYDRDANPPATVFQLSQCIGDYDSGGWMFDLSMEAEASLSEIRDRALVVLFAEDYFEGTKQAIGPVESRENVICIGRIAGESIRWDRESGLCHFTVHGLHYWLNKVKAFPVELSFVGSATDWAGMPALTVDRALWHILHWHSTAIETMDFYPTNDTHYAADGKTIASTIWGQLADLAFSKLFAAPGVDRFGRLFVEVDPQMVPEADRDWATVMTITEADWQEAIQFSRVIVTDCSLISLNAEEVNSAGSSVTRYSLWPGHVPLRYGEPEMLDRALCSSQANANALAGLLGGWRTNPYPDIPVVFAQNNRMVDCFPRQFCAITVASADTPREVAFTLNLIPRRVTFLFDADAGYFHSEVNFEGETLQQVSTNGDIPDIDEIDMETPPIPDLPSLPDLPILLPGLPGEGTASGPPKVLIHDKGTLGNNGIGLCYSKNFNSALPTWITVNAGLTLAQYRSINQVAICPNGAVYVGNIHRIGNMADYFLARAPYVGGTFVIVEDQASIDAKLGTSGITEGQLGGFACNPLVSEEVAYTLLDYPALSLHVYYGLNGAFAETLTPFTMTSYPMSISYGSGEWVITGRENALQFCAWILNRDCSMLLVQHDFPFTKAVFWHVRVLTTGRLFSFAVDGDALYSGDNNRTTITLTGSGVSNNNNNTLALDPTGTYMMAKPGDPEKSSDAGATWTNIGSLPAAQNWAFAYAGGAGTTSRWIGGAAYLYYSESFGVTWVSKMGNLNALNPLFYVDVVRVVEF